MEIANSLEEDNMLISLILTLTVLGGFWICYASGAFYGFIWLWALPVSFAGLFLLLLALAFAFLWIACQLADSDKPQEKDSKFYRSLANLYVAALIPLVRVKITTRGLEKTPREGRFMLVCNHLHEADPAILLHYFKKSQLAFISKQENKDMLIVGKLMPKLLCQLMNRENDREALKTILKCIQLLKDDKASIAVFPEGYIHKDKKLHHFRSGVFKIATKTKVPIVVCTIRDTRFVLEKLKKLQPSSVDVRLLQVIEPEEYENITTVDLAERIYQIMAQDLGPDLVSQEEEKA